MNATQRDQKGRMSDETIAYPREGSPAGDPPATGPPPAEVSRASRYVFASGDRPLEGFTIKRAIGRGGFGEVYYATSDAGKEVALKLITRNHEVERRGVLHCMNLKSPHLITIFDLRESDDGDTFVVMEYVAGPSLANILANHPHGLPLPEVRAWLKGLVEGVDYLHEHGIVHRDLKPANLFLEDGVVKIGDYGLSKSLSASGESGMTENVGTCYYMAPEISRGRYHRPIDIYAIGVILFEMITGKVPFEGQTAQEVLWKHLTDQADLSPIPEPFRAVVRRALAKDPNVRPQTALELLLPEDLPPDPGVRIIERQASSPPLANPLISAPSPGVTQPYPAAGSPPSAEEPLVIRDEEPVLYIGPDTQPPGCRRPGRNRLFGGTRRASPTRSLPRQVPRASSRPVPPPPEPPEPPTSRLRIAELAASMLWSAPLAAFAAAMLLPAYEALQIPLPQNPIQLAYLFGMLLIGTWAVLIPGKLWEPRHNPQWAQRLSYLAIGAVVGLIGVSLAHWTFLTPSPVNLVPFGQESVELEVLDTDLSLYPATMSFVGYMALAFAANGWWKLTSRDRWRRVRFLPIAKAGAIAAVVGLICPGPRPWGTLLIAMIALIVQLVSPWSRAAALHTAWVNATQSRGRAA